MNRKHASIALVVMSLLCAASHGQGTPPSQEGGDGEETSSRCGRWHEGPLERVITSAVPPKQLEPVDGAIGCSTIPCTLDGWRRWTRFLTPSSPFEVRNKLWFFNTDSNDPMPGGSEYGGNANSTDESRDHNGSAKWSRRYTYTRGEDALAEKGIRATLIVEATVTVELNLVLTAPDCATGACVEGRGLSVMTFETQGLQALSSELGKLFQNRAVEEGMQQWYVPSDTAPETLRRKVSLHQVCCQGQTTSAWNGSFQLWPLGFGMGTEGPMSGGQLSRHVAKVDMKKKIPMCIRPPAPLPDGSDGWFELSLEAEGETGTTLLRTIFSEAKAGVEVKKFKVVFEPGCVDCAPPEQGVDIDSSIGDS